ncbi:bis(5'-adenosyl)-triphosphatase enpp4-like isoform X2 [Zootermopsis nevadensis]|uniref:bis(5'-adenosyl)-triphosphatase enpp4-like isoform X2 n=1 Tax=Zootermopsis nevadensis TaxID=136037 RepID=UPI000B8EAB1F|nr:bis(5'-adenosyl)-triphosphatase enpp4-like isoform X2 [Zootermopsis nevadensis]
MARCQVCMKGILYIVLSYCHHVGSTSDYPIILVVSYDGFRYNYFDKNITPNINKVRTSGSHAEYMRNVFITKTFPNHHSIATGVYPEVHGILANYVYDPHYGKILRYSDEFWHFNDAVVPIWTLNEKAGEGRHSGVMMWPGGGDEVYQNTTLTFSHGYNSSVPFSDRVDTVLSWILHPQTPANLVFLYFEEPDKTAHVYGPESQEVQEVIVKVDDVTGYLVKKLEENNLTDAVNVFLLSDHGFETVTTSRIINVTDVIKGMNYTVVGNSPTLHIYPNDGDGDAIYNALKNASKEIGHFSVYHKEEILERWHYKNNRRAPPIFVLADESYAFDDMYQYVDEYEKSTNKTITDNVTFGVHGYDNNEKNMQPFFVAFGPLIKKQYKIAPFDNVDLYSLFCYMLYLNSSVTNGTLDNVKSLLASEPDPSLSYILGGVVVAALSLTAAAILTLCLLRHRQKKADSLGQSYRLEMKQLICA